MKLSTLAKVLSALAAAVGAVYILATYGDKIVAWAKKLVDRTQPTIASFHFNYDESAEQECPSANEVVKEEVAPSTAESEAAEVTPVASEEDFEG